MAAETIGAVLGRESLKPRVEVVSGGERAVTWMRENPRELAQMLAEVDQLISGWNRVSKFAPSFYSCSARLREALNGEPLPPLIERGGGLASLRALYNTIKSLSYGMELGQGRGGAGAYKFHLQEPPLNDDALVLGAIFHAYEIQVGVQNPRLVARVKRYTGLEKNYILDPLVEEVVTLGPTNPILENVVGNRRHGRLDWVYGYDPFSNGLQSLFLQKEMWSR